MSKSSTSNINLIKGSNKIIQNSFQTRNIFQQHFELVLVTLIQRGLSLTGTKLSTRNLYYFRWWSESTKTPIEMSAPVLTTIIVMHFNWKYYFMFWTWPHYCTTVLSTVRISRKQLNRASNSSQINYTILWLRHWGLLIKR